MKLIKATLITSVASLPALALAAPPDLTSITTAVDFSTVTAAILGVGAACIGMYLAWRGAKFVIGAVKSM
ncbi:MAG: hypothetical protein ACK5Q1_08000 [Limnobacter sp.]|jgi:hypothetical protein